MSDVDALLRDAAAHKNAGRLVEAAALLERALDVQPELHDARNELGLLLIRTGKTSEATEQWRRVVAADPNHAGAHQNLAHAILGGGRPDAAFPYAVRAAQLRPDLPDSYELLGEVFDRIGRGDDAINCFREAIRLSGSQQQHRVRPWQLLGMALTRRGDVADAVAVYRDACAKMPFDARLHSALLVALHYLPDLSPEDIGREHVEWNAQHAAALAPSQQTYSNDRSPDRRPRIGYVSGDFRDHPVASFIAPILASHDHADFEIVCYYTNPFADELTPRLRAHADLWRDVGTVGDDALAAHVRDDGIDILVDLSGHTGFNRLLVLARKPAPVQLTYLGYCDTTGMPAIDCLITDEIADPPMDDSRYVEKLLRLDSGFSTFSPPANAPDVNVRPAGERITFGSLNGLAKLNARVIELWSRLLRAVPESKLLIARHELRGVAADRLRQLFRDNGIADDRVELRCDFDARQYLTLYHEIDIALDVQPWSGHTTACEALWMGVPVVTMYGRSHAGRMVASVLYHAGLSDLVAADEAGYIDIAWRLYSDRVALTRMRQSLRQTLVASPVMNGGRDVTATLEEAYRAAWGRYVAQHG